MREMEMDRLTARAVLGSCGILIKNEHHLRIPLLTLLLASKEFFSEPPPPSRATLKSTIGPSFRAKWEIGPEQKHERPIVKMQTQCLRLSAWSLRFPAQPSSVIYQAKHGSCQVSDRTPRSRLFSLF